MVLTGLHLILTYQCTLECDHCFVWGSPRQNGVMSLAILRTIFEQARDLGTVTSIYFEGGEPFLYYPILLQGVQEAARQGFETGIVTNAYWAVSEEDALAALRPFAGLVQDLSVSSDLYHWSELLSQQAQNASLAAQKLGLPCNLISIARPEDEAAYGSGQLPAGESGVMYRGRAAAALAGKAPHHPWEEFNRCPYEDLRDPGRLHLDPLGYVHVCQGITLGNFFQTSLSEIWARYDPESHPITGPLLNGGPAELARQAQLPAIGGYADACHLCYTSRRVLRERYPDILAPDQVYGV